MADAQAAEIDALGQRMRSDWCGFGAREAAREASPDSQADGLSSPVKVAQQVLETAHQAAVRSWIQTLRRRGDGRSLAVAEFLGGDDRETESPGSGSRARLHELARHSTDPMITALALARPCEPGGCRNVEVAQWSRLEPDNIQAWLPLLAAAGPHGHQTAYVLERMAQTRMSRSYRQELGQILVSALQETQPGLGQQAETETLPGILAALPAPGIKDTSAACADARKGPGLAAGCLAMAEALWQGDDVLDRRYAMALARSAVVHLPAQRPAWEERAQALEAVEAFSSLNASAQAQAWSRLNETAPCAAVAALREVVIDQITQGEWRSTQAQMQAAGADVGALAGQRRRERGRGLLDPVPSKTGP